MRDQEQFQHTGAFRVAVDNQPNADDTSFFKISPNKGTSSENLLLMNTDVWNNATVVKTTGYSMQMIRKPLYELSMFIKHSLSPDRL